MRVVLAPDSFKESMTAREAARAMAEGVKDADPRARTVLAPMSDGGEGFVDAVAAAWGADLVDADTVDALGRPIRAVYGLSGGRAVMDVAGCAGLELIAPADRDVLRSSTAGLGLLMRDALRRGARTILLGIGGSATNDAGVGMLHALGAGLLAAAGVLALFIFGLLLGALTTGLSHVMPLWAAFLVVALILTVIAVPMALIGIKRLKAAKADTPTPQEGLMESVNAVKGAVASGLERGNAQ